MINLFNRSREASQEKSKLTTNGTGKLYIGNLNFQVQEFEVKQEFEQNFGQVIDVKIIRKNISGIQFKETNYGFIHMRNPDEADYALNNFNKQSNMPWIISTYNDKTKFKNQLGLKLFTQINDIQKKTFDMFPNLMDLQTDEPKIMQQLLQGGVLVREVFLGNLSPECDQKCIENNLTIYGEIDQVDFFNKTPPFAFVKFKKAENAYKSVEAHQTIALILSSINIKIQVSDHEKRPNIVGDQFGYESNEDLSNFIYIGFHGSIQMANEKEIKNELQRYGDVKQLYLKQSNFQINGQRSFILAELESIEQVKKIYKKYMKEDRSSERRRRLGDIRCDVQLVLKPQRIQINKNRIMNNIQQIQNLGFNQQTERQQNTNENQFVDLLKQMIEQKPQEQQQYQDENKNAFWSGFFTRSKAHRVGVDAIVLEGSEPNFNDFNLNVSHRITIDELMKKNAQCLAVFHPSNETQLKQFQEYITYFTEKNRAGVINIRTLSLYILPKIDKFKDLSVINNNEIIGIFCDSNHDLNRINLSQYLNQKQLPFQQNDFQKEQLNIDNIDMNLLNDVLPLLENPDIMNIIKNV